VVGARDGWRFPPDPVSGEARARPERKRGAGPSAVPGRAITAVWAGRGSRVERHGVPRLERADYRPLVPLGRRAGR
jgi:hypothetical protein